MMRLLILRSIFVVLMCSSLSPWLAAQQQIQIIGPTVICPEFCETYTLSGLAGGSSTVAEVFWYTEDNPDIILSNEPIVTLCPPFTSSSFVLYAFGITSNGQSFGDSLQIEVLYFQPTLRITSNAAELCPAANSQNPGSQDCELVCAGATVTYTWSSDSGAPSFYNVEASVQGAERYELFQQLNSLVVTWGAAGPGSITFFGYSYNNTCGPSIQSICVEKLAIPKASFITTPAAVNDTITICRGQEVLFQNTSEDAESYSWNLGNGQTSTQANPSALYPDPGVYEVELTAFNACLCSNMTSLTVVVEAGESPLVDCVSTICEQAVNTYTAQASCGSYAWSVSSNGTILEGGGLQDDYITIEWGQGPEGFIELAVTDCASLNTCLEPSFIRIPILSDNDVITGPTNVCRGELASYSIPPFEGTSFTWSVSSFGTILSGQGTPEVVVDWFAGFIPSQQQWVAVVYDNCYLGCGGADTLEVRINPEFYLSGPIEACEGSSTSYQALRLPGNTPVACNWRVETADGTVMWASAMPTATPTIDWNMPAGLYRLLATPDNIDAFCTPEQSTIVNLIALPPAVDSLIGPAFICPGEVYTFEAASSLSNARFQWVVDDGSNSYNRDGRINTVSFGALAPYGLQVAQINPQGCVSPAVSLNLEALPPPTIQGPTEMCNENLTTFRTEDFEGLSYQWDISPAGAGIIIGERDKSSIEVLWRHTGPATVSVQRCGQSVSTPLQIHALPEPTVQFMPVCPGKAEQVQALPALSLHEWYDVEGNLLSTAAMPQLPAGTYRLLAADQNGCFGDTVFHIPLLPAAQVSISTPDPKAFCNVTPSTRLYALNTSAGYSYQWYHDGNPVGINSASYTATSAGQYYVEAATPDGCTVLSNTINIIEDCSGGGGPPSCDVPGVSFSIQPTSICNERGYQISNLNYVPGTIFWLFDDPASGVDNFSTLPNPTHLYSQAGFYQVLMLADYPSVADPAVEVTCGDFRVDTVFLAADFTFDTVCVGQMLAFTDLSTYLPFTNIATWDWDFGDPASGADNFSNLPNPTHVYSAPGDYAVRFEVRSSEGCLSSIIKIVSVFGAPQADFAEPPINCENTSLPFNVNAGPETVSVQWQFEGPANRSELFQSYHEFALPGTYTVTLSATSIYGCQGSFSRDITIEPNTLSGNIATTPPSPICEGDTALLAAPPGGISWQWSNGESGDHIVVAASGHYGLTLTDDKGCTYRPPAVTLEVLTAPDATIRAVEYSELLQPSAYFYDGYQACQGESVFLEIIANPAFSYSWSTGAIGPAIEFSDVRGNLLPAGTHEIFVTATNNSSGCTFTEGPFVVEISPLPSDVLITAAPAGQNCEGTPVAFSALNPLPELEYRWSNGLTGPAMSTSMAGIYSLTATNAFGCSAESAPLEILAGPNISLVPNGCYSRCLPDTLCLPDIPGIVSYQWFFEGAPLGSISGTVPELIANQSGAYYLEMTDDKGCTRQSDPLQLDLFDGFGTILGQVFFDVNDNGIIDAADTTYSGALLQLLQGGLLAGSAASDQDGNYAFSNIAATDYSIQLDTAALPPGFSALIPQVDTSLSGCDALLSIDWLLVFNCPVDTSMLSLSGCTDNPPVFDGFAFDRDTSFAAVYQSFIGCDSVVVVTIQVFPSDTTSLQLQTCPGTMVDYNGTALSPGQQAEFLFQNATGCDSLVTVSVLELAASSFDVQLEACPGTTVDYNGTALSPGQQAEFLFLNAAGCDSVVTVSVLELAASSFDVQLEACAGTTVDYNGTALSPGQQAEFLFQNAAGCDSLVTVSVLELAASSFDVQLEACAGTTVDYNGTALSPGQQAEFLFQNAAGCDSVVTVSVLELAASSFDVQLEACTGTTVDYNGTALSPGQQAEFLFQNAAGCDSVVTVSVLELAASSFDVQLEACAGTTVDYNGTALSPGQQAEFLFQNAAGCDSLVSVTVVLAPPIVAEIEVAPTCVDSAAGGAEIQLSGTTTLPARFSLDGQPYQEQSIFQGLAAGSYQVLVEDANGCTEVFTFEIDAQPRLLVEIESLPIDCENPSGELTALVLSGDDGQLSLSWSNGAEGATLATSVAGTYTLLARNRCEEVRLEGILENLLPDQSKLLYLPNAFSPNEDQSNDVFRSFFKPDITVTQYELVVFDRWGNMLFRTEDPNSGWDGYYKGRLMNTGVYVWQMRANIVICDQDAELYEKGEVYLVR